MKFKSYTGITWSLLELTSLVEDEDSHVHLERVKKHLGLHPFHLSNIHVALNEILSSNLNFYDSELKGFPLAYKNPKLITPLGEVFYDTYFIHIDIEADFYVFRPQLEITLKGIVNKKGSNHIGVLVHKAFNVSIPSTEDTEDWVGLRTEIGQEVKFNITHLDFNSRLPFIRGVLDESDYLQQCEPVKKKEINCITEAAVTRKKQGKSKEKCRKLSWMSIDKNNDEASTSDLETSQEEIIKQPKKTSKKSVKKETQVPDESTLAETEKPKKCHKKLNRMSKDICPSSDSENDHTQNDIKPVERISQNNVSSYSDHEEDNRDFTSKQSADEFNESVASEKPEKNSSKKRSKRSKLSNVKLEFDVGSVKPDPEAAIDSGKKVKLKRNSKNKNNDVDESMQETGEPDACSEKSRKQSKRSIWSTKEGENNVRVKRENIEYESEASNITATPKKRRLNVKHSDIETDEDETEQKPSVETIKKRTKRSTESNMIFDYDDVTVKSEKFNDSMKSVQNGSEQKRNKSEQVCEFSNAQERKSKKESKKLSRSYHNMSGTENDYGSIEIKSENVDDTMVVNKREHIFHSPAKVTIKKKPQKKNSSVPKDSPTISKQEKKRKQIDFDLDESDLDIKPERSFSVKREDTDNESTKGNREEDAEPSRIKPKKQPRKRNASTSDSKEDHSVPIKSENINNVSLHINSEEETHFDKYLSKKQVRTHKSSITEC